MGKPCWLIAILLCMSFPLTSQDIDTTSPSFRQRSPETIAEQIEDKSERVSIPGRPPALDNPPSGCRFHPRCPHCLPDNVALYFRQTTERPRLREITAGHFVACHLVDA